MPAQDHSERWHWKISVKDQFGRDRTLGVGAEAGFVIFALLDHDEKTGKPDENKILGFSKADPDEADKLVLGVGVASDWARSQRREPS